MGGENIHECYQKSLDLLKKLSTEKGFLASIDDSQNYKRVWARDGVITGLTSLMTNNRYLIKTLKKLLYLLKKHQDKTGRIPSNIDLEEKDVSYGTLVGKIDATLWYIIGVSKYYFKTNDEEFIDEFKPSLKKCFFYLKSIELNGKGLLYVPTGGDWADEYITHGYVLFDQLLYLQAIREYEKILKKTNNERLQNQFLEKKNKLTKLIITNYFPKKQKRNELSVYNRTLYEKILNEFNEDYALSYFSSDGFSRHLDSFANVLILNIGLGIFKEEKIVENFLKKKLKSQRIKILPAFWPPVTPKEKYLWKILRMNSLFEFKNKPHYYHNGGLWPIIQGFFISGLKDKKKKMFYLKNFARVLKNDNYEFCEFYESLNYTPQGIKNMAYTASGYLIAYLSTIKNKKIF